MKKTLFAIAAMVAMVACNNDYVVKETAQEAIGFDNMFVDNSTRSVNDPSFNAGNLTNFHVYGYVEGAPLFNDESTNDENDGVDVTKNGDKWSYNGTQYWIAGANYIFNAVAPATNGGWTKVVATDATDATNATQTTLSFTNNGTTDLLYATAAQKGLVSNNPKVAFTFRHTLSKVKFSFENAYNASNATIRVKNIQITDAYKTGDVVLKAATETTPTAWTPGTNDLALSFGMATDDQTTDAKEDVEVAFAYGKTYESQKELFMIPGAGATDITVTNADKSTTSYNDAYTVQFTVELLVSGEKISDYNHTIYTTFVPQPGKSYDLKAVINPENIDPDHAQEPIEFTVTEITDWDNDHDGKENTPEGDTDTDNQVDTELN
jgi:hypothetical protein